MMLLPPPTPVAGQTPLIEQVVPLQGKPGDTIEILGSDFSGLPDGNLVYFGAVRATVVSTQAHRLLVRVPMGATYGPVTVASRGLVVRSTTDFVPTFDAPPGLTAQDWGAPVALLVDGAPTDVALGDLDQDGRTEVVVAQGHLAVIPNLTADGVLSAASFGEPVRWTDVPARQVVVADFDGDGRLDLAAAGEGNAGPVLSLLENRSQGGLEATSFLLRSVRTIGGFGLTVEELDVADLDADGRLDLIALVRGLNRVALFKNTSTPGGVAFNAAVNWFVGDNPVSLALADIDGDGREDLALGSSTGQVMLYPNTSTEGVIGADTFGRETTINATFRTEGLTLADLNRDDRPELILGGSFLRVSVLPHEGVNGRIDRQTYGSRRTLSGRGDENNIGVADLDGDGWPDLMAPNRDHDQMTLYRHKGEQGALSVESFEAGLRIPAGTFPFGLAVGDLNGDAKPELVTANTNTGMVGIIENLKPLTTGVGLEDGAFPAPARYRLDGFPNPFVGQATFSVTVPTPDHVRMEVWDSMGRRVDVLHEGRLGLGQHTFTWSAGEKAAGLYWIRMVTPQGMMSRALVLSR